MEVRAVSKYVRVSPKKARPVADLIRGKNAHEASVMLKHMPVRAAGELLLTLNSAMANAENNFNLDKKELIISKVTVDGGPALKRMRFTGRSRISPLRKPTAHITVIVSGDVKTKKVAEKKTEEKKIETAEDHKIEVDRPEGSRNDSLRIASNVNTKKQMFRRKTG